MTADRTRLGQFLGGGIAGTARLARIETSGQGHSAEIVLAVILCPIDN